MLMAMRGLSTHPGISVMVSQTAFLTARSPHESVLLLFLTLVTCVLHVGHPFFPLQRVFRYSGEGLTYVFSCCAVFCRKVSCPCAPPMLQAVLPPCVSTSLVRVIGFFICPSERIQEG